MPRAAEAVGVRRKLADYSLNPNHERGRAKARGFALTLGITADHIDYLEIAILTGVIKTPIKAVRDNSIYGVVCVVDIPVRGVASKDGRIVDVRTVWEIFGFEAPPRLVSVYPRP